MTRAMGVRMSGFPISARTAPSRYCTIEWIMDSGWIITEIWSFCALKSHFASMNSKPLFIMVAESTEIFRPMLQVGCATASSGVIASKGLRSLFRNGPPEPVRRSLDTPAAFRSQ